jgi:hypothetical protein
MKKIKLELYCTNPNKIKHDFDLYYLQNLDVVYQCKNCPYQFLDIVEKPEWLLKEIENENT